MKATYDYTIADIKDCDGDDWGWWWILACWLTLGAVWACIWLFAMEDERSTVTFVERPGEQFDVDYYLFEGFETGDRVSVTFEGSEIVECDSLEAEEAA